MQTPEEGTSHEREEDETEQIGEGALGQESLQACTEKGKLIARDDNFRVYVHDVGQCLMERCGWDRTCRWELGWRRRVEMDEVCKVMCDDIGQRREDTKQEHGS